MYAKLCGALLALVLSCGGNAWSEPAGDPQSLAPVVVTASRIPEKAGDVTAHMTVIPREEIRKNQYQDMGNLLRNHGLQVDSYTPNSGLSQISLRGVRSSAMGSDLQGSILLLVDGRRIGTDNISMIPLVNVERIEIIRGPAAVQYGTSAMGGVVNVITRRGTEKLAVSAEGGLGSWNTWQGQAEAAGKYGPFDFSGGISSLHADEYATGGGKTYANTGLNAKTAYNVNLGLNFGEEHRLGVTVVSLAADDMGNPGYIDDLQYADYTSRSNYSGDFLYEGGHRDAGLSWKARYFTGRNNYVSDRHYDPFATSYFHSQTDYQGSQGQITFKKSVLTLTGGVDWLRYDTNVKGYYYPTEESSSYDNLGVFLLAKIGLFDDRLILSGGVRNDDYILRVQGRDKDLHRVSPSFGIAWHATDWLTLKGNYGEAYRIPDAIALLGFKGMFTYLPNPDLRPEKSRGYDLGFEVARKSLRLEGAYFQTRYEDKLLTRFTPSYDTQYYNSSDDIWLRGLEGGASYDLGEALDWPCALRPYVRFTHLLERRNESGARVLNVSDWDLAYGLTFSHPDWGLTADLRFTYLGRQYVQDFNSQSATSGQVVETGNKTVADLFLSQRLHAWQDAGTLSVNLAVRNIFDEKYACIKDYPMPGRSFYVGLRYEY